MLWLDHIGLQNDEQQSSFEREGPEDECELYNNNNSIVHHTAERTNPDVLMWDDTELVDTNNTNADVENCILEILDDWMVINDQSFIMYHYLEYKD